MSGDHSALLAPVVQAGASSGLIGHMTLSQTTGGRWQAALRLPGASGYRVSIADGVAEAIIGLFSPIPGQSWTTIFPGKLGETLDELTDDEDMEDIL